MQIGQTEKFSRKVKEEDRTGRYNTKEGYYSSYKYGDSHGDSHRNSHGDNHSNKNSYSYKDRRNQTSNHGESNYSSKSNPQVGRVLSSHSSKQGNKHSNKDNRKAARQLGIRWTTRYIFHLFLPFIVKPPKTLRSEFYRAGYIKKNKGIFRFINKKNPKRSKYYYICIYCFRPVELHNMEVDHIKPIDRGGMNWTPNLGSACFRCNRKKSNKGGLWVIRGRIGKVIVTTLQIISNLYFGITRKLSRKLFKGNEFVPKVLKLGVLTLAALWGIYFLLL